MNKGTILRALMSVCLLLFFYVNEVAAKAHNVENISIHVYLHDDGSATITETRKAYLSEGTENYIPIENLGRSEITNFVVSEGDIIYEYIDPWDIDATQEEKTYKNGIIKTVAGYELAWGIGPYGAHEYKIQYEVSDIIKQLKDDQMLFWRFINDEMNTPPENVRIEIETDRLITEENEKIWAFGFEGEIHFENGKVVARSHKPFKSSNYATVLIQFPDESFTANDFVDQTFAEVQEEAFKGSEYDDGSGGTFLAILILVLFVGVHILILYLIYRLIRFIFRQIKENTFKRQFEGEYNRQLPYEWNFLDLQYVFDKINLGSNNNILTALILKWIYEERLSVETELTGLIAKRHQATIQFHRTGDFERSSEEEIFNLLLRQADANFKLSHSDLGRKWPAKDKEKMYDLLNKFTFDSRMFLEEHNYVRNRVRKKFIFSMEEYVFTQEGEALRDEVYKFVNFLYDFSLLNEHEAINVKLWDELMIWAAALGMTKEVMEQFSSIYPNYAQETSYNLTTLSSIHSFSSYASTAGAPNSSGSGIGGGGGSTSSGGGGGSFGGGSGGGTR